MFATSIDRLFCENLVVLVFSDSTWWEEGSQTEVDQELEPETELDLSDIESLMGASGDGDAGQNDTGNDF